MTSPKLHATLPISPMNLEEEEQEQYFNRFFESHWQPSATADNFFAERRAAGKGFGMDEAGNLVYEARIF